MRQIIIILLSINLSVELSSFEFLENKNTIPEANEVFILKSSLENDSIILSWILRMAIICI